MTCTSYIEFYKSLFLSHGLVGSFRLMLISFLSVYCLFVVGCKLFIEVGYGILKFTFGIPLEITDILVWFCLISARIC